MNVKKFIAASARDALRKVKETLGPDAIILSNRGVPGGVEIMAVASRDMAMIVPTPARHEVAVEDYKVSLAGVGRGSAAAAPAMAPRRAMPPLRENPAPQAAPTAAPAVTRAVPRPEPIPQVRRPVREEDDIPSSVMMDEIRALRKIVEQHLAGFAWGEAARLEPVKTEMLRHMLDAGFSPQFSREMLLDLPHELDMPQALAWVKGAADRCLRTITSDSDVIDQGACSPWWGPPGWARPPPRPSWPPGAWYAMGPANWPW